MWRGIFGHDDVVDRFRRTLASGRLASTYLFVGPPGVGKRQFAMELARSLLCTEAPDAALEPCERCESCRMFAAGNHPDLDVIGLRTDKSELAISQFVGFDEVLKQDALCHRIALKPFFGGRRVAIVDDADHFNLYSANCLLKTLEEPPPESLLILIGTSPARQLPTIRSRSQVVRFAPLDRETVARILVEQGLVPDEQQARRAAELSEGSIERAVQLADPALGDFRQLLISELVAPMLESVRLARSVQAFVDEAGKEGPQRRERLRIVLGFAVDLYRSQLRNEFTPAWDALIHALEACLDALEQVNRNANLAMVIQNWCEELAGARGGTDDCHEVVAGLMGFANGCSGSGTDRLAGFGKMAVGDLPHHVLKLSILAQDGRIPTVNRSIPTSCGARRRHKSGTLFFGRSVGCDAFSYFVRRCGAIRFVDWFRCDCKRSRAYSA